MIEIATSGNYKVNEEEKHSRNAKFGWYRYDTYFAFPVQASDGEERDKTKKTLEKLIDLLDKGVEIYSSANAPEEIKLLFPALETEKLIESKEVKFLPAKEEA